LGFAPETNCFELPYFFAILNQVQVYHKPTTKASQPTISRDIHYIQLEMRKSAENYDKHRFEVYRNNLLGLDEMIKKLWTIADSPKTDSKEKIKAIVLIGDYYREKMQLIRNEPGLIKQIKDRDHFDRMKQW
jgi:hypothetical protein